MQSESRIAGMGRDARSSGRLGKLRSRAVRSADMVSARLGDGLNAFDVQDNGENKTKNAAKESLLTFESAP